MRMDNSNNNNCNSYTCVDAPTCVLACTESVLSSFLFLSSSWCFICFFRGGQRKKERAMILSFICTRLARSRPPALGLRDRRETTVLKNK